MHTHLKKVHIRVTEGGRTSALLPYAQGAPDLCTHHEATSTTRGLKKHEIGWARDNRPVDGLIIQLLPFLIESLHRLHFWPSC